MDLVKTIRDEIAGCSEKAYDFLTIRDLKQMLLFTSDKELAVYIQEDHADWEVKDGRVYLQNAKDSASSKEIPALQLINQMLSYARELERIV